MPTAAELVGMRAVDLREFRNQPLLLQRIKLAEALRAMTPEQRRAYDVAKADAALAERRRVAFVNAFKNYKPATLTKAQTNTAIEKVRELSLDDSNPDQWLNFFKALRSREIQGLPLGKFRFEWGENGKPVYVPWTQASWENFFSHPQRGRWIPNIPFLYKCDKNWETHWTGEHVKNSANAARQFPNTDFRHVWQHKSGATKCKRPKKSLWVKVRKVVVGAAIIVAAVYLGPTIVSKVKSVAGGLPGGGGAAGGTGAAGTVAQATTFQKIQAGTKTLLTYVNKARTVKAIVKGELPPPPIGIPGSSFRDWAFIVAKEKIKEEAIDAAMTAGQKYIAKKMSAKEEAILRAEIAEMQRQLIALTPPEVLAMPPEPNPELAEPIKKIQVIEGQRQAELQKLIIPGAIIAGTLLLI